MLQRSLSKKSTTDVTPSAPAQAPASGVASPTSRSSAQDRVGNSALAGRASAPATAAAGAATPAQATPSRAAPAVTPVARGTSPTKRGPELAVGEDGKAPTTAAPGQETGVLRPDSFRAGQKGALIGRGAQVEIQSSEKGGSVVARVADGAPASIVSSKGTRVKVQVRNGSSNVEGWVDKAVFSDQPAVSKDEENKKLADDYVYSPIGGDQSPKSPTGKDTAQGALGDCFFIASMAAVANAAPGVITDMVKYDPKKKTYTVRFYEESGRGASKPVYIEVDGYLPTSAGSRNDPAYAGDPGGKMWPAIVEKAYAKWKGGYDVIGEGGLGEQAMAEMTGGKSTFKNPASMKEKDVIPYFQNAKKDGKAIYAGVVSGVKSSQQAVLSGSGDGAYKGKVKQSHRWNEIVPGSVSVSDSKGTAPRARDGGKDGDVTGKLDGRGIKSGSVGYKDSAVELTYDKGKGPADARDLIVDFDFHGVVDLESFLIGDHGYAFEGVVGDKLQFYNPWGTYQPKPISAATFLKYFDSIALNAPPASKTKS